ncbi:MAG TPA: membrane protein insertase YidC [Thermoanaerobaculia bacterium]|nr:membrane protein insertase YidC [Thermoanaerobaculia bacterium]
MEKRLFLAVFLSIAFLFAWGALAPKLFPELARKPATPASSQAPTAADAQPTDTGGVATALTLDAAEAAPPIPPAAAENIERPVVRSPLYRAVFTNRGAQLTAFELLRYPKRSGGEPIDLVAPRAEERTDFPFAITTSDPRITHLVNSALYEVEETTLQKGRSLVFRWAGEGVAVEKTFRFDPEDYLFEFDIRLEASESLSWRVSIGPGMREILPEDEANRFIGVGNGIIQQGGDLDSIRRDKEDEFRFFPGTPEYFGLHDNYFLTVFRPSRGSGVVFLPIRLVTGAPGEDERGRQELYAAFNASGNRASGVAYFGPKEVARLDAHGFENTLELGIFGFISRVLLTALLWMNTWTHNYGWAIVVLTIIIKVLLYPLQHKSMVSMKKMQQVQPKMNAIKDRFKKAKTDPDQRQKMNLEMMKLYKEEGINPASGCVPILLQLPILWGFYTLLSKAIELRGAPFILWIADLSAKDPYYITPLLMTVTMFIQQLITPTTVDPIQRKIFLAMPIVFGWFFKEFPSGLVLYWLVQNILSIIQQMIINKYWSSHPPAVEKGA